MKCREESRNSREMGRRNTPNENVAKTEKFGDGNGKKLPGKCGHPSSRKTENFGEGNGERLPRNSGILFHARWLATPMVDVAIPAQGSSSGFPEGVAVVTAEFPLDVRSLLFVLQKSVHHDVGHAGVLLA